MASAASKWADSVYSQLSMDQRIGQLFMLAAYSGGEKMNREEIEKQIREHHIGGLIFMQGTAKAQAELTNAYQAISKTPLLIAMDAEWGLGMRLTGIRDMPRQIMLGASRDTSLMYRMASAIASQCKRLGVHVNFAPVVDVNNNPSNPVINFRSFGENKQIVAQMAIQYMKGLQDNGVIACAKHFPGHGDTDVDSHYDLPVIKKTEQQLDQLEFYPFKKLIVNGIKSIMIAHLQVPSLEAKNNTPTTLSYSTVTGLLKEKFAYNGLLFTDALNMKGVTKYYQSGEVDLLAFLAGNDILLFSENVAIAKEKIKQAIQNGTLTDERLEESVKKILRAKYEVGLYSVKTIDTQNIDADINEFTSTIRMQSAEAAATLLNDPYQVLDVIRKKGLKKAVYIACGIEKDNVIIRELKRLGLRKVIFLNDEKDDIYRFVKRLKSSDAVLVGIHQMSGYPAKNFGIDSTTRLALQLLHQNKNTLHLLFGNPYALSHFCDASGMLVAYDDADETQQVIARIVNSQLKANGKLPVSVCTKYKSGDGISALTSTLGEPKDTIIMLNPTKATTNETETTTPQMRHIDDRVLECCVSPLAIGVDIRELDKLDQFINQSIQSGAFPGCRILAAKGGKVFYDRAFGHHTQDKYMSVDINTVYDLASVTKVAATTLAIMKLYDQGKLQLHAPLGKYLPATKGSDKEYLKIKDILTHEAGLKSWIPFYKETTDSLKQPKSTLYRKSPSGKFNIKVCSNLYLHEDWTDTMMQRILKSPLENKGKYVYSDLDFILLQQVVEQITQLPLDLYLKETFYKPMGLRSMVFNPKQNTPRAEIPPTEMDNYFRHQIIRGYVHDMGAAMYGGVSGHAGLFSNATDLAVIFQMLLNKGLYQGRRYFKESTVELFTSKGSQISRRGLGFDKPDIAGKSSPCADHASLKTFGHQGFTGTCVWADPTHDIVFVFLSNRTYPSADNKKINTLHVRETAQAYIYKSMGIPSRR